MNEEKNLVQPKVFVSYCHKDGPVFDQVRTHLRPLERDGLVQSWTDQSVEIGDRWQEEVEEALSAASVAVLIVSASFLASDLIMTQELPRILAREAAGKLKVFPIFLSDCLAADLVVSFTDEQTGQRRTRKLADFQGIGSPKEPLAGFSWSDRERELTGLARRLLALSGSGAAPAAPSTSWREAAVLSSVGPVREYMLTVRLERRDDVLEAHYHLPGTEAIGSTVRSWKEIAADVAPIARALDLGGDFSVPASWGESLARVLFGPDPQWRPVLRALFGAPDPAPQPTPLRGPVRLRVCTEDPLLSGLPWRLTSWNSRELVDAGWVFEVSPAVDSTGNVTTTAPCHVLVVAPASAAEAGKLHDPAHPKAVAEVLGDVWPTGREAGYLRVARTRRELEKALAGMRPHLFYVYATGEVVGGRPALVLDGDKEGTVDRLPLGRLASLFQEAGHWPAVLYLNTAGLVAPGASPAQALEGCLPLVLWRRLPVWTPESTSLALAWLRRWLGRGEDPVVALHEVARDDAAPSLEAATLAVSTAYRGWSTPAYQALTVQDRYARLRLDRREQKALVARDLRELIRGDGFRTLALVAYAAPGNAIHSLAAQLEHDLELEIEPFAAIKWRRLEFPSRRQQLREDLQDELRLQLEAETNEVTPHLLRRHAPKALRPGRRAVLWLDWGCFGEGHQPPLSPPQIGAWLRFSSEFLTVQCPADLRLVSFLAIETEPARHPRLRQTLADLESEPWCQSPAFLLTVLPPLGDIAEADLRKFLRDPGNTSCDPGIQTEIARRIIQRTGGNFEQTVALLEEAQKGSWYDLLNRLQYEQGGTPPVDDEPF
jgi:TIR domain